MRDSFSLGGRPITYTCLGQYATLDLPNTQPIDALRSFKLIDTQSNHGGFTFRALRFISGSLFA
jgi:hypothetical protein